MTSNGDIWMGQRAPRLSVWVPCKAAGMEFVRDVPRHSRTTLFDTRSHITKGSHLPDSSWSQRWNKSKTSLPNLSITSLSKTWDRKLDPIILSTLKKTPGISFDRMLRGKSLMSTAQYYELKRLYEGRPLTPQERIPCRLKALPRTHSITETMEQAMYYLQRPLTLLPPQNKHDHSRIRPGIVTRADTLPDQGISMCVTSVKDGLLAMPTKNASCPSAIATLVKSKSAGGNLTSYMEGQHLANSRCGYQGSSSLNSSESRKSFSREAGQGPSSSLKTFHTRTDSGQFFFSETQERVFLDLQDTPSAASRQTGRTTCNSSEANVTPFGQFPQTPGSIRMQAPLGLLKPEVSVKLKVVGNKPRSFGLQNIPQVPVHGEEVVLETQLLSHVEESDLNITGKKVENKTSTPVVNYLNYTRDYRHGHVVPQGQSCCHRLESHWTANELFTQNLRKVRAGPSRALGNISPQDSRELDSERKQLFAPSSVQDEVPDFMDYGVTAGSVNGVWQRDESTVRISSSSSSNSSSESENCDTRSSSPSSSLSIQTSPSEMTTSLPENKGHTELVPEGMLPEEDENKKCDAESNARSKTKVIQSAHSTAIYTMPKRYGQQTGRLAFIQACGRISPLPASLRHSNNKRHLVGQQTVTAEGKSAMFASSVQSLAIPSPFRSPLPLPSFFQSSSSRWHLHGSSPNPWYTGRVILTPVPQGHVVRASSQTTEKAAGVQTTKKKAHKRTKVCRRKKRRPKAEPISRYDSNMTDTSSRSGASAQHAKFLCFTPMYDLRYDQWKRQCSRRKHTSGCNLSIKATSTPCNRVSESNVLHIGSDSDDSEDISDSEDDHSYATLDGSTGVYQPSFTPSCERERANNSAILQHHSQHSCSLAITGTSSSISHTSSSWGNKGVYMSVLEGDACGTGLQTPVCREESPKCRNDRDNPGELAEGNPEEKCRSGDEVGLSSSEMFELESTGRVCTCSSAGETHGCTTDGEARSETRDIPDVSQGHKKQQKQQTVDTGRSSLRDVSRLSSCSGTSSMWLTDSLSVTAVGYPLPSDAESSGVNRLESGGSRKKGQNGNDNGTEEVNKKTLTLDKILGFLPNIGLEQSDSSQKSDQLSSSSRHSHTSSCKTALEQSLSRSSSMDNNVQERGLDPPWRKTPSFTLRSSKRSRSRRLAGD